MRLLFIGESWLGSCARSLKEALARQPAVSLDEVNEDLFLPSPRARWLRAINRLLRPAYQQELERQVLYRIGAFRPDIVMAYKGYAISERFIQQWREQGCYAINVYPDNSPHAYGAHHQQAVGAYDLVISTKPFHPTLWNTTYGYRNTCRFVPQGYDPALHLVPDLPERPRFDLVLVATWRPEYGDLMGKLGKLLAGKGISVGIGGNGWAAHRADYPAEWVFAGELQGRAYIDWLRQGKICLAPLTREVIINGTRQPGDEDTTRTYELAAAHCFFMHRRTDFVRTLYDEHSEVPMFDTAEELAEKILHYLLRAEERARMAAAAHRRAVPAYSLDSRAAEIVAAVSGHLASRNTIPGQA